MPPTPRDLRRTAALVFLASLVLYLPDALLVPIYAKGEAREALLATQVAAGRGLLLPRRPDGGVPAKPPLFHWLAAGTLAAGVAPRELAVRLPNVLLGAAGVALTAALVAQAAGVTAALVAAIVLASSFEWLRAATESRVDMTLTFFMVAAIVTWRLALRSPARWPAPIGWAAAALAVLAKGPVGMVLPALVVVTDALLAGEGTRLRRLVGWPAALAVLVVGGWYVAAASLGGDAFTQRQLLHENLHRFLGIGKVEHAHSALYYPPVLAAGLLPWTLVAPWALWQLRREDLARLRFPLAWAAVVLAFYTLASGKRGVYLLPLYPPLAAVLGAGLARAFARGETQRGVALGLGGVLVAAGAVAVAVPYLPGDWLAALGRALGGADQNRLPAAVAVLRDHGPALAGTLTAAGLLAALVLAARGARTRLGALAGLAAVWVFGLTGFATLPLARALTPRDFAADVRAVVRPEDRLCVLGDVPDSFRFYLGRPLSRCRALCAPDTPRVFAVRRGSFVAGAAERCLTTRLVENVIAGVPLRLEENRPPDALAR